MEEIDLNKVATINKKTVDNSKLEPLTIICTPNTRGEMEYIYRLEEFFSKVKFEVICITSISKGWVEDYDFFSTDVQYLQVPEGLTTSAKRNIGRQLASTKSKYLLFLNDFTELSEEWLKSRIQGYLLNPLVGVIGKEEPPIHKQLQDELYEGLQKIIRLSEEDFQARCCLKDFFRSVKPNSFSTTVELFDKIGGFDIKETEAELVYQARVQALGYGLIPLPK